MNRLSRIGAVSACLFASSTVLAGEIDQGLHDVLAEAKEDEVVSTLVYLWDQGDIDQLTQDLREERATRATRNQAVVQQLQQTASITQGDLLAHLETLQAEGTIEQVQTFWIANVIRVDTTADVIEALTQHPDVMRIYYNMPIEGIAPIEPDDGERGRDQEEFEPLSGGGASTPEPGVEAVRAPEVWNELGYTGEGILVATLDTGVDGNHPALGSRWRGHDPAYSGNPEWAWFDPVTNTTFPEEFSWSSHGTHTMGTVLGGAPGDAVGVAPGSEWIHAAVIDRVGIDQTVADAIAAFEWMVAPTGNPGDVWAVPHVCSNSWGLLTSHGYPNCDDTFWSFIDNSEAAGTVQLFSAGNEGTSGLRRPADRATNEYQSVAVGAIDPHDPSWPIAGFSSQGPTSCTPDGSSATKPDISAPGVNTRSAISGGGYSQKSGTSMASPHVNGVVALMLEACPDLTTDEVKQILYDTAVDLGTPGKNNVYGYGNVDAYEAVLMAEGNCGLSLTLPEGAPTQFDAGEARTFLVKIEENRENIVPGTEQVFYRFSADDEFTVDQLVSLGDNLYEATIPGPACDQTPQFYVRVEGDEGTVRTNPASAPENVHEGYVGEFITTEVFMVDFQDGLPDGWTKDGLWQVTNDCQVDPPCSGDLFAYYGQSGTCNYETGGANSGEMLSAPIELPTVPPGGTIEVTFCHLCETESLQSYDVPTFSVVGGPSTVLGDSSTWTEFSMNLTAFAGETIQLSWHFDTIDGILNDFLGWQVDHVRIEVTELECEDPVACHGDLTGDGEVGSQDLTMLLGAWGPCENCDEDLTGDGVVDIQDLLELLEHWGPCE